MVASASDLIQKFLFVGFPVRGELVHLRAAWQEVLARHDYPESIRELLGQSLAAAVLLASTLKFNGRLTLQIQGDGPVSLLLAQCSSELTLRGLARWRELPDGAGFAALVASGRMVITIETDGDEQRYQGIVPLDGTTLAECIEGYFKNSEQLEAGIQLVANDEVAAGLLVQRMPDEKDAAGTPSEDWTRVRLLAASLADAELVTLPDQVILQRLFHEEELLLPAGRKLSFHCPCNRNRVAQALTVLGRDDLADLLAERGNIDVACEFCNRNYQFDPVDAEELFVGTLHGDGRSTELH